MSKIPDPPRGPHISYGHYPSAPPVEVPDVTGDSQPAFSPTGTKLVFTLGSGIYIANTDGSGRHWVTSGYTPDWQYKT
jgi:hypothetical protein